jgi:hypothetical protein
MNRYDIALGKKPTIIDKEKSTVFLPIRHQNVSDKKKINIDEILDSIQL